MRTSLGEILGVTGRLARLGFAVRLLAAGLFFALFAIAATEIFGLTISEDPDRLWEERAPEYLLVALVLVLLVPLSARRIRDIGAPVLPVLAVLVGIDVAEWFVLPHLTDARLPEPLESFTPLGGILSLAALLWLLLWPGRQTGSP